MQIDAENSELRQILVDKVDRNPENPRVVFRPKELEELLESIRVYGVQVPIAVYKEGSIFVLIDGERRWKCCLKLNKKTIPALVQEKPSPLTNLLLMFNIHALREQWDYLTIALMLPRVTKLLTETLGREPSEAELSEKSGLTRGAIRRCKLLIDLPTQYQQEILTDLNKPKSQQTLSEDLFIEMERALKTVERALPEVISNKDLVRRVLIDKYKKNVITSIPQFRQIAKIARAERVEADKGTAVRALCSLFKQNDYSITQAYEESVSGAYSERDLLTRISGLRDLMKTIGKADLDDQLRKALRALVKEVEKLLEEE